MNRRPLCSMTGFGSAMRESARHRFEARIRSLNHRSLDISLRLPEIARSSESRLRGVVSSRLHRGRVEVSVDLRSLRAAPVEVQIDRELLTALLDGASEAVAGRSDVAQASLGHLLGLPGVVAVNQRGPAWEDEDEEALVGVVEAALEELAATREREGEALRGVFERGFSDLLGHSRALAAARPLSMERARARLEARVREVSGEGSLSEERLEQEVVFLADRSDIEEELERLGGHLSHASEVLAEVRPVGKQLDFLLQEIQRELSTLGAKCRDLEMARGVVEARTVCEQMREQVLNVE